MRHAIILSILFTSFPFLPSNTWAACPDGHLVYSKGAVQIMDRAKIQGGSVRGEDTVKIGMDAQVMGDLFGKAAVLLDRATIQGNVTTSATLTQSNSAVVSGTITQNTPLPPCSLSEEPTVPFGTVDITVPLDSLNTLLPGSYRDLLVHSRGTVSLQPGVYNFRKITLEPDAKIFIQAGGEVGIHVQERVFLDDRVQMILDGQGGIPNVRIYSNQTTAFQVGHDCKLFGTIIAPKTELHILDRTAIQGRIQANRVVLEAEAVITSSLDSDGDGVPDLVENMLGTDPGSSASKPALAVPTKWFVDPTQSNTLTYNYSTFSGYSSRSGVSVTIPSGTLASNLVPVVSVSTTLDASVPAPIMPAGWGKSGQYFEVKGSVKPGEKVLFAFPLPSSASSTLQPSSLVIRHFEKNQWLYEPVESVLNGVAYAYVRSLSPFFVMANTASSPVIYLNCGWPATNNENNPGAGRHGTSWTDAYTTLDSALADAAVSKKEIWAVGGHASPSSDERLYHHWGAEGTAWQWTDGLRIYGGFSGSETSRDQRDPKNYKTVFTPGYIYSPYPGRYSEKYVNTWRIAEFLSSGSVYIDGVVFGFSRFGGNLKNSFSDGTALLQHHGNMTFRGCSFLDLVGYTDSPGSKWGGAIRLTGHDAVLVLDSCRFLRCWMPIWGGALAVEPRTTAILTKTLFDGNGLGNFQVGGAAIVNAGHLIVKSSIFTGNRGASGAAILAIQDTAARTDTTARASVMIENSVFYGNFSSKYSNIIGSPRFGILFADSAASMDVVNSSIVNNFGESDLEAAVYAYKNSTIRLKNSILWGNINRPDGGSTPPAFPAEIFTASSGKVFANHCDIWGGISGSAVLGDPIVDEGGNIGADTLVHNPRFLNASTGPGIDAAYFTEDDGFQLGAANSGAFDKGLASLQSATDILGKLRAPRHSMGAYEFLHTVPVVAIVYPGRDTAVTSRILTVRYEINGVASSRTDTLNEGTNRVVVSKTEFGLTGADTLLINVDTTPPAIAITYPGRDTAVTTTPIVVQYTVDGAPFTRTVNLVTGVNEVVVNESDSLGNHAAAVRKIYYSLTAIVPIVADAKAKDTVFTYDLFTLDARGSRGPDGAVLAYTWRQILGASIYINTTTSRVAGVVSRGQNRLRFELTVADGSGFFASAKDTVTVEVREPANMLEFAQALEEAKSNQDGAFALTIAPAGESSRYTLDNSISLQGSLAGTSGAFGTIRWYCNGRTGTFLPPGENWNSPAIALDPGDNWITLVYTQGSQIASDRILVSRGEVDMVGFDMNPNVLWADSAMSFKLVVNVYDPALSNIHLVRITDREVDMGELVDDGTGGDDFASDRRYTLQFDLTPNADSVYWFRVRANKSGVNSYSALYTFHPQQKYNPTTFQDILNVHANASALFEALQATRSDRVAMDSVANWLIEQPSVTTAGIGPGEKAICWQYSNGVHAMISNAPAGTRGSGKVKTKALSPFQYDGPFGLFDDGITGYRGAVIPAAQADTGLFAADSLLLNSSSTDSNVTVEHWKNWGGYSAVMVATHGNTFGYDSLSQIKRKPRQDTSTGKSFWAAPYITFLTHQKADTSSGSKYWSDLTSGGKSYPRLILAKMRGGIEYGITAKFFAAYNKNVNGTLVSIGACRSLYNENFWNSVRANGDAKTAMIGYSDYVDGRFAGKSAEIIFKSLVKGKTLKQSVDSVVTFCGQNGNGFCFTKNGKAWDSVAYLDYRGDSNYTLVPRKGRAWAWGSGSGRLNNCVAAIADTVPIIKNITKVSGGFGHGLALEVNGTVWGWGWNGAGQLGLAPSGGGGSVPTVNYRSCTPLQVFPGIGYKAIAAGASRSLAVDAAGKVWRAGEFTGSSPIGWTNDGSNTWAAGVVGVASQRDSVAGLSNIATVAAGGVHNMALHANGEVWAWGGNSSGELGFGDTLSRPTPAKIPGLANIVAIAAGQDLSVGLGSSHSLALDRSGKVWAWGENEFGQLGVGDTTDRKSPQLLSGLTRIKSISAGIGGSSAVDSTGKLWVWGWNAQGQLGLGNTNDQKVPVQVPALSNIVSVAHGVFPVAINNAGNAMWSCGSACGNTFVSKKNGSLEVGAGGDEFGLSIAP